jgi:hypothetical protein
MKKSFFFLSLLVFSIALNAQTSLQPGDIAFTGVNMDGTDQFSFVFLIDIESGTEIKFTDNGWMADNSWRSGEGVQVWTADRSYSKGEEIILDADGPQLSASGDQIIAYQNDSDMVAAINDEGAHIWQSDATSANTSALPNGLTNGTNCVALEEKDNIKYDRSVTTGTKEELLDAINNYNNWNGSNSTTQSLSTDGFTVEDSSLPVELSAFNAIQVGTNSVRIHWVTQSETEILGYNIFKNTALEIQNSQKLNNLLIDSNNSTITENYDYVDEDVFPKTQYYYWLQSVEMSGKMELFGPISFVISESGGNSGNNQNQFFQIKLGKNYPNPFNPRTTINFSLDENQFTEINIFNIRGELVKNLYHKVAQKGLNSIAWNGKDNEDREVAGGIYFYKMKTENYQSIRRMVLLK